MKKFKFKKYIKIKYKKIIIFIIILLSLMILLKKTETLKILNLNPLQTIKYSNINTKIKIEKEINNITKQILKIDINKPTTILKNGNL